MFARLKSLVGLSNTASAQSADEPGDPARRRLLLGLAAAGGAALALPVLGRIDEAQAAPMTERPDLLDALEPGDEIDATPIQYGGRRRRWRRRELARLCRNDRRFRRNNRGLCRRVTGRIGRPGACVQVGPITICE